ncbi:glycosyltransferase family 39 protein [Cohnella xylanilytica]|uniref:Glycosyltransferase family 39 protein n=1 Tax=Cohnella xylanilytica TaxID=557555 RepID=A0A841UC40_9BACL|nr:glycosyltransferase family 39 protein [Cohnella xylanilytica]MBB6695763.1 glycosyltransferase family 39 protein [Cohnella xylanilytica]
MKLANRTIALGGGLFFLVALIASVLTAADRIGSVWATVLSLAVAFGLAIGAFRLSLAGRLSGRVFLAVALGLGFLIRLAWILWNPTPPASDFQVMYEAARAAAAGDFAFSQKPYYTNFPYQFGFTMYQALVIRLFGDSLFALRLLNVLFGVGTAAILYLAGSRAYNESCGRIAALVYLLYPPNIIMGSVLTNQHISGFLLLTGCLVLLRGRHSKLAWLPAGVLLALGQLMRPIAIVYLAAIVLFFLASLWKRRPFFPRYALAAGARVAGMIAAYYLVLALASASLNVGGVTDRSLFGGDKYWKFMVGLNASTDGRWSAEDAKYSNSYPAGEERSRAQLVKIRERLSDPAETAALMGRKLVQLWGGADASAYWSLQGTGRENDWDKPLNRVERAMYVLLCAFGCAAMVSLWRRGRSGEAAFYTLLLLLYAGIHLLIEIQPRYRLDLIPALLLVQSYGAYRVYGWVRELRLPTGLPGARERDRTGGFGA